MNEKAESTETEYTIEEPVMHSFTTMLREGIWDNNMVLSQMLALCPLLAVTSTATNGLGMGLATLVVLVISNFAVSLIRDFVTQEIRIPIFVLIIAAIVTIGLGVGVNTGIFSILNGVAFRGLPAPGPEQLVAVSQQVQGVPRGANNFAEFTTVEYEAYRDRSETLAGVCAQAACR